jgi:hypothetical protein
MKTFCVAVVLMAGGGIAHAPAQEWAAPVNMGPVVNSSADDVLAFLSRDELSLYFSSNRPGGFADPATGLPSVDIWVSQRERADGPWGSPAPLGANINSGANDRSPSLSRDGHFLYYSTDRPGGFGHLDIWVSYREHTQDDFGWQPPVNVGSGVNTDAPDFAPRFLENDETGRPPQLYCQSRRPTFFDDSDMFVSEIRPDGSYGPAVLIPELSTPFDDQGLAISRNGNEVFFNSDRQPGSGLNDMWTSTRGTINSPWSTPVNLGPVVNTAFQDQFAALSSDGRTLIFSSNRLDPNRVGGMDLYITTRQKRH